MNEQEIKTLSLKQKDLINYIMSVIPTQLSNPLLTLQVEDRKKYFEAKAKITEGVGTIIALLNEYI